MQYNHLENYLNHQWIQGASFCNQETSNLSGSTAIIFSEVKVNSSMMKIILYVAALLAVQSTVSLASPVACSGTDHQSERILKTGLRILNKIMVKLIIRLCVLNIILHIEDQLLPNSYYASSSFSVCIHSVLVDPRSEDSLTLSGKYVKWSSQKN